MGPVFGVKGGATGGGKTTVEPSAGINLGFTGDIHAIGSAHNLLSALLDNHLYHGNSLDMDPDRSGWPRTLDVEDRALRHIQTWTGPREKVATRSGRFLITAASEVMAVLALSRDYADLKERLGRMLVGVTRSGRPLRASDLGRPGRWPPFCATRSNPTSRRAPRATRYSFTRARSPTSRTGPRAVLRSSSP